MDSIRQVIDANDCTCGESDRGLIAKGKEDGKAGSVRGFDSAAQTYGAAMLDDNALAYP